MQILIIHTMIKNRISTNTKWVWTLLFAMIAITGWANYFDWQSASVIFGLLIVPYILKTSPVKYCGYRYLYWCIGFAILTAILPVKTFLYFAIVFGILFLVRKCIQAIMSPGIGDNAYHITDFQLCDYSIHFPLETETVCTGGEPVNIYKSFSCK